MSVAAPDPRDRDLLAIRSMEIEVEIAEIQAGRVVDGDPYEVELALVEEAEDIEDALTSGGFAAGPEGA